MTTTMFVILVTICCAISGLLTEGIKVWCKNAEKPYSANLIALIDAIIVGCGGGVTAYILLGIAFTTPNILCLVLMSGLYERNPWEYSKRDCKNNLATICA